jgi:signal transduction histidine kinase
MSEHVHMRLKAGLPQSPSNAGGPSTSAGSIDWSVTSLGSTEHWPQSLRTVLSLCLSFPAPACLVWGAERTSLFNERYEAFCAAQGSPSPGQDFAECWRAQWSTISPAFERARRGEPALIDISLPVLAALSFVPVLGEGDVVGGVLVICSARDHELQRAEKDFEMLDYVISHDLHAPLRTMQEMARLLSAEPATAAPEGAGIFLQHFLQATAKLDERIEGLVRFRKISRQPLTKQRVDVAGMIDRLLAEERASVAGQGVSVILGELPAAFGDYDLIRQAFAAMLANAFKFVRDAQAPRITIGAHHESDRTAYFIADNGAGFDMKYAGRLFGLFQRLHNEAQFKGAGIGLALARRAIERHGGTMRAEARKGQGATFELILPRQDDPSPSSGDG